MIPFNFDTPLARERQAAAERDRQAALRSGAFTASGLDPADAVYVPSNRELDAMAAANRRLASALTGAPAKSAASAKPPLKPVASPGKGTRADIEAVIREGRALQARMNRPGSAKFAAFGLPRALEALAFARGAR